MTTDAWLHETQRFLEELLETQAELLALLRSKSRLLVEPDVERLQQVQAQEERLLRRLEGFHRRREQLLQAQAQGGDPPPTLQAALGQAPRAARHRLRPLLEQARHQSQLLRAESITHWVVVQRVLIHLAQLLELLATGGQGATTYDGLSRQSRGALMDEAA